jgi:hypothetical protein
MECDAIELRCQNAADETDALQPGQRAIIDLDALAVPPHTLFELLFDLVSTLPTAGQRLESSYPRPRQFARGGKAVI